MAQGVRAGTSPTSRRRASSARRSGASGRRVLARRPACTIEDRCPHLGFPLHQGTVESGLVTCHWHHARFRPRVGLHARPVGGRRPRASTSTSSTATYFVRAARDRCGGHLAATAARRPRGGHHARHRQVGARLARRRRDPAEIVRTGIDFGTRYRDQGWGAGSRR